jgi:hypothetical protein
MPWLPRKQYENLLRRNDDRDFSAMLKEIERMRSDVRGLRTWLQRNLEALDDMKDDEQEAPPEPDTPVAMPIPGGWGRR